MTVYRWHAFNKINNRENKFLSKLIQFQIKI